MSSPLTQPQHFSQPGRRAAKGNAETIGRNTLWYGIEIVGGILSTFATSILIARAIGPDKLGYFSYIMWLASISATVGSLGVPATTRKYMAEYFGRGEPEVSRAIFEMTLRFQLAIAGIITSVGLILVFAISDRQYWWSSAFLVASILPSMLTAIPAQANVAAENLKANVASGLVASLVYFLFVALSLGLGWGLPGIALGLLIGRSSEVVIRLIQARRRMRAFPVVALPEQLRSRMWTFSGFSTVLMLLQVVVWGRSDIVLLKLIGGSVREITFYSVAFNVTEKVLLLLSAFGGAIGATVMAQFGRNRDALRLLVARAARYMFLCGLPALLGLAFLSSSFVQALYGREYLPVIPVLFWAALLAIPKTMLIPVQQLLEANEHQRFLVLWTCVCGAINIGADLMLIPAHGALGAAIGNGVGQLFAVLGIWARATSLLQIRLPWRELMLIGISGGLMAVTLFGLRELGSGWPTLALGVVAGSAVYILMLRLFRLITIEDRLRILRASQRTPRRVSLCLNRFVSVVSRA